MDRDQEAELQLGDNNDNQQQHNNRMSALAARPPRPPTSEVEDRGLRQAQFAFRGMSEAVMAHTGESGHLQCILVGVNVM